MLRRKYLHRIATTEEAQAWQTHIRSLVDQAIARDAEEAIRAEYGERTVRYYRAKTLALHNSQRFQYCIATLILIAFAADVGEAQVLPAQGRYVFCVRVKVSTNRPFLFCNGHRGTDPLFILPKNSTSCSMMEVFFLCTEVLMAVLFTLELLANIFAKSNDCFRPFISELMNLFDLFVVIVSVGSLLLRLMSGDAELPSLKMFRSLPPPSPFNRTPLSLPSRPTCHLNSSSCASCLTAPPFPIVSGPPEPPEPPAPHSPPAARPPRPPPSPPLHITDCITH